MSDNYQREGIPMRVSGGDPIHMDVEPARVIEAVSPEVAVSGITGGHRLTVTDLHGEHSFDVMDGAPGQPGQDGQDGAPGQPGQNGRDGAQGQPGQPGADGVSPTVTVTDITGGHRVTITDADEAHSFDVMDGEGGGVEDVQVNGTSVVSDGVAEVSMASDTVPGVVKVLSGYGIYLYEDTLRTALPNLGQIKAGNNNTLPLTVSNQHNAAFYGLAKAAGDTTQSQSSAAVGQYTEAAKSAIRGMLGAADGSDYRLIYSMTATEAANVTVETDLNGDPISLSSVFVLVTCPSDQAASSSVVVDAYDGSIQKGIGYINTNSGTVEKKRGYCIIDASHGLWKTEMTAFGTSGITSLQTYVRFTDVLGGHITKVALRGLIAGYTVNVYGY